VHYYQGILYCYVDNKAQKRFEILSGLEGNKTDVQFCEFGDKFTYCNLKNLKSIIELV